MKQAWVVLQVWMKMSAFKINDNFQSEATEQYFKTEDHWVESMD